IHREGTLSVERHGVELAVDRQSRFHWGKKIVVVVVLEIVQAGKPALFAPDRGFVGADRDNVILAALGRNIGGDLLTEDVLLEDHPIDLIPGLLLPSRRQLLHDDHVVVVHCRDRQGFGVDEGRTSRGDGDASRHSFKPNHGVPLLISDLTVTPYVTTYQNVSTMSIVCIIILLRT